MKLIFLPALNPILKEMPLVQLPRPVLDCRMCTSPSPFLPLNSTLWSTVSHFHKQLSISPHPYQYSAFPILFF